MAEKAREYPELRFQGFSGAWEKRKLGKLVGGLTDGDWIEKDHIFEDGKYRIIQTGNIGISEYLNKVNNAKYLNQIDFDELSANEIFPGDILISRLAEPAGRATVLPDIGFPMVTAVDVAIARPSDTYSVSFVVSEINSERVLRIISDKATGSTRKRISRKNLENIELRVTNLEEQHKIGTFFAKIDKLITVNQRKLNALKKLKRAYLQKMFPKNGVSIPELRFAGFTTAWEKRKLGDIATFNPVSKIPNRFEYVDLESVVGTEMVFHRTELKENAPSRAQRLAVRGDLFFQTVRPYQKNNYLFDLPDKNYVFSTGYAQIRPMYSGYFLLAMVQRTEVVNKVLERCTGTSYPAISSKDLSELQILIPPSDEQIKIGSFFKSLDELITVNQRKLDKLKELKKGYLQKMFI
ncbi:MAG: restriction endonuclease subunit S [Oenococcus oeni]